MTKRLKPGTPAPNFKAQSWDGQTVHLADLTGKRVWLAFFRYASCPLCNLRVRDMIRQYESLSARGLTIVAVFQSPPDSIAQYVGKQKPPFPLVSDPDEHLYRLYGLEASWFAFLDPRNLPLFSSALGAGFQMGRMEGTVSRVPGDFLIDDLGRIHTAFYGGKIADHIPFAAIESFLSGGAQS